MGKRGPKVQDLTGMKFGRLTVIKQAENKNNKVRWLCRCDCGVEKIVKGGSLRNGETKSCGCLRLDYDRQRSLNAVKHTKMYKLWANLVSTYCNNHVYYNGRRITLYHQWFCDYRAFYDYVSKLEHFGEEGYKFFRIDKNRSFLPGNVCWSTQETRLCDFFVEYEGVKMSLRQAAKVSGISYSTLLARYHKGLSGWKLFRQVDHTSLVEYEGEKMSLKQAAQASGIPYGTLASRYRKGYTGSELFHPIDKNPLVEYKGEKISLWRASKLSGIFFPTLHYRYHKGIELFSPA